MSVLPGKVVSIRYQMWNSADDELLDECGTDDPLVYLHGAANVVPGLESGLEGQEPGSKLELILSPTDAFGEVDPEAIQILPRTEFPDDADVQVGMAFGAFDEDEEEIVIFVCNVEKDEVTVSSNHPLAGLTLRYELEVLEVRDATPEELEHGHPHDADGACED